MSAQVPEIQRHRQNRKNNLKRCFVNAQDAVAAKYQRIEPKRVIECQMVEKQPEPEQEPKEDPKPKELSVKQQQNRIVNKNFKIYDLDGINAKKILTEDEEMERKEQSGWNDDDFDKFEKSGNVTKSLIKFTDAQKAANLRNLLKDVILFENADVSDTNWSLNKTTSLMKKVGKVETKYDAESGQCFYLFNDQIIGGGSGDTKKAAKKAADDDFLKTLKDNCFTIRSKMNFFSMESVVQKSQSSNAPSKISRDDQKLQENNLGFKMLKSLGWKGGSLGSTGSGGIIDPINLEIRIGRQGLGNDTEQFDPKYFRNLLRNFQQQNVEYDLVFASDFTKEERAKVHQIAGSLNLRTKSYGKKDERHLVISTKISPQVLRQKLLDGDKYLMEKYDIFPPLLNRNNK
jgi:hypothetical protein